MARVKLSAAARHDIEAIDKYGSARFGNDVAAEYARSIVQALLLLAQYPLGGRARPELRANTRSRTHRSHVIYYRVSGDTVFIQRFLHHSQDALARFT
jgi:toxin ParE1/3/4